MRELEKCDTIGKSKEGVRTALTNKGVTIMTDLTHIDKFNEDCRRKAIHVAEIRGDGYYVALMTPAVYRVYVLHSAGKIYDEIARTLGIHRSTAQGNAHRADLAFKRQAHFTLCSK